MRLILVVRLREQKNLETSISSPLHCVLPWTSFISLTVTLASQENWTFFAMMSVVDSKVLGRIFGSLFLVGLEAVESSSVEVFSASTDNKRKATLFQYLDYFLSFPENMPVSNTPRRMPEFCLSILLFPCCAGGRVGFWSTLEGGLQSLLQWELLVFT